MDPKDTKTKTGIIGFFDILGYQSLLQNNDASEALAETLAAFQSIPNEIQGDLKRSMFGAAPIVDIIKSTHHLIFSDTILLNLAYDDVPNDEAKITMWVVFTIFTAHLQRRLFHFGLPIRGAIAFGKYFTQESCFAGKPIVEAYQEGHLVDAAAIMYCPSAEKELKGLLEKMGEGALGHFATMYRLPFKDGESRRVRTINFASVVGPTVGSLAGDERTHVAQSFWRHQKDLPPTSYGKITNTELFIKYLKR